MWCLRLKMKVLLREEPSSAGSCGRKVKRFFRGFQRKNVVFRGCPRLLAEEPSSAGYMSFSRKNLRNLLPQLHLLLPEEPSEPSSTGYISFSRKNLQNLLPQATSPSRGRTCGTSSVDHVLLYIGFFS